MAVPIQPNVTPAQTHQAARENAAHTGASGNTGRRLATVDSTRPSSSEHFGVESTRDAEGRTFLKLQDGSRLAHADSGLEVQESAGGTQVRLPMGFEIDDKAGHLTVRGPGDRTYRAEAFRDESGRATGYAFDDPAGNRISVDLADLSYVVQNPARTLSQHIDPAGGHFLEAVAQFRDPATKAISEQVQRAYVDPGGTVHDLSSDNPRTSSLKLSSRTMEFANPRALKLKFELPLPIAQPLQGQHAARPAPPPQTAREPRSAPPPQAARELPDPHSQAPAQLRPQVQAQAPPVLNSVQPPDGDLQPFALETPSRMFRQVQPDGTLVIQLAQRISLMDGPAGLIGIDAAGQGRLAIEKTLRERGNGQPPEAQYRFNDAQGNRYTLFGESLDFIVESPPDPRTGQRRVGQVVLPQGYILTSIRGDQGTYRVETAPNGYVKTSPGVRLGIDPTTREPDRVFLPEQNLPVVPLPYPTPQFQGLASAGPVPPNLPVSGVIPEAFGPPPGQGPGEPPPQFSLDQPLGYPGGSRNAPLPGSTPDFAGGGPPDTSGAVPMGYPNPAPNGPTPWIPGTPPPVATLAGQPGQPQAPIRPSLWDKIKSFFGGSSREAPHGPPGAGYQSSPGFMQRMRGYPGERHHSTMDGMMKAMMIGNIASTALWGVGMLAMAMNPMRWGMFYSPFFF